MRASLVILGLAVSAFGANRIAWGPADDGIRMGIRFGPAKLDPDLRVVLQNVGAERREILIGNENAKGIAWGIRFLATGPDGRTHEGFELNTFVPLAALTLPAVLRLDAGATTEYLFPLRDILCVEKPGDVTFAKLIRQGCSINVTLEGDEQSAKWGNLTHPFIGKLSSGELAAPHDESH